MSQTLTYNETQLFLQIAEGDETAFRKIFYALGQRLHPFILKIVKDEGLTKELVQEVFLKLWLNREKLPAWLYRVAGNLAISHFRKQELDRRVLLEVKHNTPQADTTTIDKQSRTNHYAKMNHYMRLIAPT